MGVMFGEKKRSLVLVDTLSERFWSKVDKSGECWQWTAAIRHKKSPYGVFWYEGKNKVATHVAWFLTYGEWASKFLCHRCDNPTCVRPEHLFVGSARDNIKDKVNKDRQAKGTVQGLAKLNEIKVKEIRIRYNNGETLKSLATEFDIHISTVYEVVTLRNWRHV